MCIIGIRIEYYDYYNRFKFCKVYMNQELLFIRTHLVGEKVY